jgi:hypothetical protein
VKAKEARCARRDDCARTAAGCGRPLKLNVRCHVRKLMLLRRFWAALAVSTALAGCDAFGFNRTPEVAKSLLLGPNGKLDEATTSAALNTRFPSGTRFSDLEAFAQSLGGRCGHSQGRSWCDIPLRGVICDTRVMSLSVATRPDDTIEHIQATELARAR